MSSVLFVAPSTVSSGEALTALRTAEELGPGGRTRCWFLASEFCRPFLERSFPGRVMQLGSDLEDNQTRWRAAIETARPAVVVFADYPLLLFSSGVAPLLTDSWLAGLVGGDHALLTFDHLGYAQGPRTVYFGPPHLTFGAVVFPRCPEGMEILLPCPVNEPADVAGRVGRPVRSFVPYEPRPTDVAIAGARQRYAGARSRTLIVHITPNWAWRLADQLRLPHYRFLTALLETHLVGESRPTSVVSVNNGHLLAASNDRRLEITNLPPIPPRELETLVCAADLVVTDNAVSAAFGKAVCSLRPCALLQNSLTLAELAEIPDDPAAVLALAMENERPGAVFPFEVFPLWSRSDLDALGICAPAGYGGLFARLEMFQSRQTRRVLEEIFESPAGDNPRLAAQAAYARRLRTLPTAGDVVRSLLDVPESGRAGGRRLGRSG